MLFATHLVLAAGLARGRYPTVWVVAGAALPDLVDKPLGVAGLIPTYHSIAHSALFGVVFLCPVLLGRVIDWTPDTGRLAAVAFGWGSHLAADALHITLNGRPANTVFLLWPIVDSWDSLDAGPGAFVVQYVGTTSFYLELLIWLSVGLLVAREGRSAVGLPTGGSDESSE
ncbi:hydrolase [Halobaculum sp. MBLA0143]|uniref:hydrolase n=1 Tax=Halobaculum sp. MBLA0143 TaxID=3079933 RepID=UPI003523EC2D